MAAYQNNHYVPKSYYAPWCDKDSRMTYFHWVDDRFLCDRTSPRSAAKARDLYTLVGAPEEHMTAVETEFFTPHIDNPGARILRVIIEIGVEALMVEQRHMWVRYLMALRARTPEVIESVRVKGKDFL